MVTVSSKRRIGKVLEREKAYDRLMERGVSDVLIAAELGLSPLSVRRYATKRKARLEAALNRSFTWKAKGLSDRLLDMADTAHSRRDQDDGYRWIKAGVDAIDVLGRQAGIGRQEADVTISIQVAVPVLGPAQAGIAGEVVDGTVLRVIEAAPVTQDAG